MALLAARSKAIAVAKNHDETCNGHVLCKLVAYCSDQVT